MLKCINERTYFTVKIPPATPEYADYIFMSGGGWAYFGPAMLI